MGEPADTPRLPLDGVRVIAVEQYGAGPFGTMLMADLGAEVIKIENPADGGDVGRQVGPFFFAEGNSHFFQAFNRNKRSLTLNLKTAAGREVLEALVAESDALIDNLRGNQAERLRLTYDHLKDINPRIVCAHLSAYGREGSRKSWPGYDYLMQAEAGYLSLTGEPNGPPARFGLSIVDMMTGLMTGFALASALVGARATGRGRDVDVSLFDVALHNLNYLAAWYFNGGHQQGREPRSAHPSLTPSQLYRTRDGWIFVMCNKEKFWPLFCDKLGRPELAGDPRFRDFKARLAHRDELTELLDGIFEARDTEDWIERLSGTVPVAPVHDVAQALDNPFVREQRRVATFRPRNAGPSVEMLTGPIRLSDMDLPTHTGPQLGEDNESILTALGYTPAGIARLREQGAI